MNFKKPVIAVFILLLFGCSSWSGDYEDFKFKKAFSQTALNLRPSSEDAEIIPVQNRGDELIKILTFESKGYEIIGISELRQKNKIIERGSTITMGGRSNNFRGGARDHGGGMTRSPRGRIRGVGNTTITTADRIIDVPLEPLSDLERRYTLRFGREIGAAIILNFSDSRNCREELKLENNVSCKGYDDEINIYRISFLRKRELY
jgi:hypothetical protein